MYGNVCSYVSYTEIISTERSIGGKVHMSTKNTERLGIYLSPQLKKEIKDMADETGFTVNQLTLMALTSLTANYQQKGMFLFVDLLSPRQ
jgi:hypothetical protein